MLEPISTQAPETLRTWFLDHGEKSYRADQVIKWIHQKAAPDWRAMTNLTAQLQHKLSGTFVLSTVEFALKQGSDDTTQKFLWKLRDGQFVESVLIHANPSLSGKRSKRKTLCVSTQVGCAYGCTFCASGLEGFKRNLEPSEIIDQGLATERWHKSQSENDERLIDNLVIMGMGEPLANYNNLLMALKTLKRTSVTKSTLIEYWTLR